MRARALPGPFSFAIMRGMPRWRFAELTPATWPDLEQLFGPKGACAGCWCMYWRLPRSEYERNKGEGNRESLHRLISRGEPLGVLAYHGTSAVGWCAVAPREAYPALERSRTLKRLDNQPVWSVTCLFVQKEYRKQGLSVELVRAASKMARAHGARIVEAYPRVVRKETAAPFIWTGTLSTYTNAGFRECAAPAETRRIVRLDYT